MKPDPKKSLEGMLQSAVVVSWADLMRSTEAGLVHIQYGFAAGGTLDFVQIWSCIMRGQWLLACAYWMSASSFHGMGIHFDNGYESENLAHILDSLMQHQTAFSLPADLGRQGLLRLSVPTPEESLRLRVLDNFQTCFFDCPKLLCSKALSAGAASPTCVGLRASEAEVDVTVFAGTERHHQLTTALQALSLWHIYVVTMLLTQTGVELLVTIGQSVVGSEPKWPAPQHWWGRI